MSRSTFFHTVFKFVTPFVFVGCCCITCPPWGSGTTAKYGTGLTVNNLADWTPVPPNTNYVGAPDNRCIEVSTPTGSWGKFSFPPFGIPAGRTISGIEVRVNYVSPSGSNTVQLTKGGTLVGDTRTIAEVNNGNNTAADTVWVSAGGAADLWAAGLTLADFNNGDVGFRILQNANTFCIDAVEIIVHHGSPGGIH